jgi:hypothetical protein
VNVRDMMKTPSEALYLDVSKTIRMAADANPPVTIRQITAGHHTTDVLPLVTIVGDAVECEPSPIDHPAGPTEDAEHDDQDDEEEEREFR